MKKLTIFLLLPVLSIVFLAWCSSQQPMTEAEQAASYNMTVEEYQEVKQAAARMNMGVEEHMKMMDEDMDGMDMGDMGDMDM